MSQEPIPYGGCLFPLDLTCVDEAAWGAFPELTRTLAVALASATLHGLSAGRVGGCPITVRPARENGCLPRYEGPWGDPWMFPHVNAGGLWVNSACCGQLGPSCAVELPAPVGRIDSVRVDGVELDLADFRVDNGSLLIYQGTGACPFPLEQDLRLPDTEVGTWSITYLNAWAPDRLAAQAAAYLAFEFALACANLDPGACRLPENVTTVVRQGVTYELTQGMWPGGLTGVNEVDAWLTLVNPKGRRQTTHVYSPDMDEPTIQGGGLTSTPIYESGGDAGSSGPIEGGGGA